MKNRVISFISAKGGSGKTIISISIGKFLSELGLKVLLIDADVATNGMTLFYLDKINEGVKSKKAQFLGLFDNPYIPTSKNFLEVSENLFLFPATYLFKNYLGFNNNEFNNRIEKLVENLNKLDSFDFIIFDNQAGSESHTATIINKDISDIVLIVSEYDPMSAAGIERLKATFRDHLTYDRTWVVLNKVLPDLIDEKSSFLEISKYMPPIIWNSDVVKAYSRKEIPLDFKYGNMFTLSIIKLIDKIISSKEKELLQDFLKEKESLIKKPIYDEYAMVRERLIRYNRKRKSKISLKSANRFAYIALAVTVGGYISYAIGNIFFNESVSKDSFISSFNYIGTIVILILTILYIVLNFKIKLSNDFEDISEVESKILEERLRTLSKQRDSTVQELLKGD